MLFFEVFSIFLYEFRVSLFGKLVLRTILRRMSIGFLFQKFDFGWNYLKIRLRMRIMINCCFLEMFWFFSRLDQAINNAEKEKNLSKLIRYALLFMFDQGKTAVEALKTSNCLVWNKNWNEKDRTSESLTFFKIMRDLTIFYLSLPFLTVYRNHLMFSCSASERHNCRIWMEPASTSTILAWRPTFTVPING